MEIFILLVGVFVLVAIWDWYMDVRHKMLLATLNTGLGKIEMELARFNKWNENKAVDEVLRREVEQERPE